MAQADIDAINKGAEDLRREKTQIVDFITKSQTDLANAVNEINELKASNADNAAIIEAVNATLLPAVTETVAGLDQFTPEGTPVVEE